MTDKDKIKAQIEKLKSPKGNGDYWNGYDTALDDILSFIDSMSEEPARKVWHGMDENSSNPTDVLPNK